MEDDWVSIPTDPNAPPPREEVIDVLRRLSMDGLVKQMVLMVQLAAELYPEEVRKALAYVFDNTALMQRYDAVALVAARIEEHLGRLEDKIAYFDRFTQPQVDQAIGRLEALERRVQSASDYVKDLVSTLKRGGVLRDKGGSNARQQDQPTGRQDRPRS